MRDVGKHFTVNAMLAKESVKRRIESEDGISYTEFSYSLLQAYDFLELHRRFGCTLQMGGSDQWGNITAGMDLIRRVRGGKAHGLVMPLVTTAAGTKFGKTEAGTIWLDPALTSPYEFYQFWLNADDRDAVQYLKFFTFLDAGADRGARGRERARAGEAPRAARAGARGDAAGARRRGRARGGSGGGEAVQRRSRVDVGGASCSQVFANVPSRDGPYQPDGWRMSTLLTRVRADGVEERGDAADQAAAAST